MIVRKNLYIICPYFVSGEDMKVITLHGSGLFQKQYRFNGNMRIADALYALEAGFSMPCGGKGRCGACKARIEGDIFPPGEQEKRFLSKAEQNGGIRLCCFTEAFGDCDVYLPDTGSVSVQIEGRMPEFALKPLFDGEYGIAARYRNDNGRSCPLFFAGRERAGVGSQQKIFRRHTVQTSFRGFPIQTNTVSGAYTKVP